MKDDSISRAAAIDAAVEAADEWDGGYSRSREEIITLKLQMLPSAQQERKKGKWINRSLNILYPEYERYTCSVCGKHSYNYDFCPNCGADMRGEQDGDI